ncbi:hypothetical protein BJ165DRAFT_340557 [Panaeolus papilionaceus]|nr:hypothetical protein BJ165DRAFT_340557 [Panaeolus papilionaceus]
MFHQLGLYSHEVKYYERVLELAEQAGDDLFAGEMAFNFSCIFVFTSAVPLADALSRYRRWLYIFVTITLARYFLYAYYCFLFHPPFYRAP